MIQLFKEAIQYLKKNIYLFAIIIRIILLFTGVIANALQTRFLGKYYKGISSYLSSILSIAVIVATFGVHQAYPYYRKKEGDTFIKSYYGAVHLLILVYSITALIITIIFGIGNLYVIAAVMLPIMVYAKIVSYSALIEHPGLRNIVGLIISIVEIIVVLLLFVFAVPNMQWLVVTLLLKYVLEILFYSNIQHIQLSITSDSVIRLAQLLSFGFIPMISQVMTVLNYRIDVFMLKRYVAVEEIGVYSVGVSLVEQCWIIPETMRDIMISRLVSGKNEEEVAKVTRYSNTITCAIAILMLLFGKIIIYVLYGQEFINSYEVTIIEIFGVLGMVSMKTVAAYNTVNNMQKVNFFILAFGISINIIINMILIPIWGIRGAAVATLISYTLIGITFMLYFTRKTNLLIKDMLLVNKNDISGILSVLCKILSKKRSK